jgi:hypothetical protein
MVIFFAVNAAAEIEINKIKATAEAAGVKCVWDVQDWQGEPTPALTVHAHGNTVAGFLPAK